MAGIPVACRLGGPAPCLDDMCNGVDRTMCGLYVAGCGWEPADVCIHGFVPDSCAECAEDDDYDERFGDADYDADGRYVGG